MEAKNKELYPGLGLVTSEIAKTLKELGWIWKTPTILRVRTGEIWEPTRHIDCSVGSDFLFLPSICQVIRWLELWGLRITYKILQGKYCLCRVYDDDVTFIDAYDPEKRWESYEEMMLDVIPEALEYLKEIIFETMSWEMNGKTIYEYSRKDKFKWMLDQGNIVKTEFYSKLSYSPNEFIPCDPNLEGI